MLPSTQSALLELNRRFYQTFAAAFASTRRRIQPGVRAVLGRIPDGQRWLDLGCGSGALAVEWARQKTAGCYFGLDFSAGLLAEARAAVQSAGAPPDLTIRFEQADLASPSWAAAVSGERFDGALAFAVLHHLPGRDLRLRVLRQVRELLPPGGWFVHSEWQFQHSPRLMARVQPWELAGLSAADVEEGDYLLDWRHALPGQGEQTGLRYVHLFDRAELERLAADSGFEITESFESDGEGGRLGLYQWWRAV
ncbi:MAG TPA: methyltransferase domain-containing protein [Chloroflexi bacterium]|jgi:SAM-dependent methyltransferase|nr:methyltransferase domain-containing protein [Chloroflexota bacterium]